MSSESKKEFRDYTPDELEDLCNNNPNLFNELADDAIEEACIGKTPERTRKLRQMQWLIDAQLRKAKTPLGRMLIMENIFYNRVYGYDGLLTQLLSGCRELVRVFEKLDQASSQKLKHI